MIAIKPPITEIRIIINKGLIFTSLIEEEEIEKTKNKVVHPIVIIPDILNIQDIVLNAEKSFIGYSYGGLINYKAVSNCSGLESRSILVNIKSGLKCGFLGSRN